MTGKTPDDTLEKSIPEGDNRSNRSYQIICAALIVLSLVLAGALLATSLGAPSGSNAQTPPASPSDSVASSSASGTAAVAAEPEHEHEWQPIYGIREVPAETHEVEHPAVIGTRTVNHTVCNTCMENVDGAVEAHIEATGHEAYTHDVPVSEQYVEQEAYVETVVDVPARAEIIVTGYGCEECGETQRDEAGEQ